MYFQIDDAPSNKTSSKNQARYTLIKDGNIIYKDVPSSVLRSYSKKHYIPFGVGPKKIWRSFLIKNNYQIYETS